MDRGVCSACPAPWAAATPEGTRAVWKNVVRLHVAGTAICLLWLSLLLCDTSALSVPLMVYSGTVLAYLGVRSVIASFKGYPVLTATQKWALLLLPFYGVPAVFVLFYLAQAVRHGN